MGQPIIRHQGLGFLLADMQPHTDAARALLYPVWEKDTQWTWFLKNSRRFSEQMFLIDEGYISTYGDMLCLVRQISGGLYTCGLRPGMMAAVDMANRRELIASVFALSRLGCTAVMVNPRLCEEEREYVLRKSDAGGCYDRREHRHLQAENDFRGTLCANEAV